MDKYLAPSKDELQSNLKREFRQRQEQARKARIFNPRVRLIGVDKDALDQHVHEKEHQKISKCKEELCYALEQERQTKILKEELDKLAEEKFQAQCELNAYRNNCQRKEQSREFDLNDPEYLRKMPTSDGLDWLGEDPCNSHRIKLQREQQKSWLQQQMYEKNEIKRNMQEVKKAIEMDALCKDAQLKESDQMQRKQRQQWQADTAKYNLALAREQYAKRMQNKRREEEDNLAEIMNNISSDMLTESKDASISASLFGGNRIVPTMYRGMTNDQIREIRLEQLRQIEEKQSKTAKMKESDYHFDEIMKSRTNLLESEEQDVRRQKLQTMTEQQFTNAQLLREQKQRNHHLNEEVYKFKPTEEYFEQFNTTTR